MPARCQQKYMYFSFPENHPVETFLAREFDYEVISVHMNKQTWLELGCLMSCQLWWHWTVALNQHLYNDMQPVTNQHANKFVGIAAHRLNTTKHSSLCPAHLNSHLIDPHCLTMELTISMYSKCLIYDWCKKKSYQLPRTFQDLPNLNSRKR